MHFVLGIKGWSLSEYTKTPHKTSNKFQISYSTSNCKIYCHLNKSLNEILTNEIFKKNTKLIDWLVCCFLAGLDLKEEDAVEVYHYYGLHLSSSFLI